MACDMEMPAALNFLGVPQLTGFAWNQLTLQIDTHW